MGNIIEEATQYENKTTKNISELNIITLDVDVKVYEGINEEGDTYTYKYVEAEGEKYRLPNSVLSQLKALIAEGVQLDAFKVRRDGEGLKTRYTVIPLLVGKNNS